MTLLQMPSVALAVPAVLARLRSETRCAHDAVERLFDVGGRALTGAASYRRMLARFYGFYSPSEAMLLSRVGAAAARAGISLKDRAKTPLLLADLQALPGTPALSLPLCSDLPALKSDSAAWGCLYVLEGATLGGQVISRMVHEQLGITPDTGGLFFHGYGARTAAMWREMRVALAAAGDRPDHADAMVAGALETFHSLHRWCEREASA